jgi:polyhydroxybutyrate depolymerase
MTREHIEVGGRRRTYLHRTPLFRRTEAPLVLALHGTTQQGARMRSFGGGTLDGFADAIGADTVYLDGWRRAWNDGRRSRYSPAQKHEVDDVSFVRAVVERYGRPTIAVGYSNGGQLIHRLLREAPGLFVGAATIASGMPVPEDFLLDGVDPDRVPIVLFHGTADPVVPYDGGPTKMLGRTRGDVRSAVATAESYVVPGADGTVPAPTVTRTGDVERRDWDGVRLVTQFGVGHVIPNRRTSPAPLFVGPSHHDLDTGEEIRSFLGL